MELSEERQIYLRAIQSLNWVGNHLDLIIFHASEIKDNFPMLAQMLMVVDELYQTMANHISGGPSISLPQYDNLIVDNSDLSAFAGAFRATFEYLVHRMQKVFGIRTKTNDTGMALKLDDIKKAMCKKDRGLMNDFYWFAATINSYCHFEEGSVTLWEISLLISRFHLVVGAIPECIESYKEFSRAGVRGVKVDKPVMCRHFQGRGKCTLGDKCTFSHATDKRKICAFYNSNGCAQGDECPFTHVLI